MQQQIRLDDITVYGLGLDGKTALLSGASRGIGRAIAVALGEAGADVVGVARSEDVLAELARELDSRSQRFYAIPADLRDVRGLVDVAERACAWNGRLDILVNCAGMIIRSEPPDVQPEEWDELFAVNVRAPFFLSQAVGRLMLNGEGGSIINIASLAAEVVTGASVMYQASKAAVVQMTRGLAVRLAPRIRVNAIGPGYIRTRINTAWLDDETNRHYVLSRTPLERIGTPDDVVGAVLFLASSASGFVTGQHLLVDGGWSTQ